MFSIKFHPCFWYTMNDESIHRVQYYYNVYFSLYISSCLLYVTILIQIKVPIAKRPLNKSISSRLSIIDSPIFTDRSFNLVPVVERSV